MPIYLYDPTPGSWQARAHQYVPEKMNHTESLTWLREAWVKKPHIKKAMMTQAYMLKRHGKKCWYDLRPPAEVKKTAWVQALKGIIKKGLV